MARSLERLRKQYAAKPGEMMKGPRQGPPGRGMTGKPKNAGRTIRRLMGYVGRYWYKLVLVLLCMLVTTVTSLCGGYLMAPIVDHLALAVNPDTVITMSPFEKIADEIVAHGCDADGNLPSLPKIGKDGILKVLNMAK